MHRTHPREVYYDELLCILCFEAVPSTITENLHNPSSLRSFGHLFGNRPSPSDGHHSHVSFSGLVCEDGKGAEA